VSDSGQSAKMDFESEQRFHDLEQRHISLKREHEIIAIDKEALKGSWDGSWWAAHAKLMFLAFMFLQQKWHLSNHC
jgi:hypothetical protein